MPKLSSDDGNRWPLAGLCPHAFATTLEFAERIAGSSFFSGHSCVQVSCSGCSVQIFGRISTYSDLLAPSSPAASQRWVSKECACCLVLSRGCFRVCRSSFIAYVFFGECCFAREVVCCLRGRVGTKGSISDKAVLCKQLRCSNGFARRQPFINPCRIPTCSKFLVAYS